MSSAFEPGWVIYQSWVGYLWSSCGRNISTAAGFKDYTLIASTTLPLAINIIAITIIAINIIAIVLLRYERSTLILYKELSSPIFQSCQSVSQSVSEASVTPVQISTLCNI